MLGFNTVENVVTKCWGLFLCVVECQLLKKYMTMSLAHAIVIIPLKIFGAICRSIFHSWLKLRWTPSSQSWLKKLDKEIRSKLSHTNHGDWVEVTLRETVHRIWTVRVEGEGQGSVPIVLIHGMLGGSNMFLNNIDALAEQRDVILIDLPGFGLSSRPQLRSKLDANGWWVDTTGDDVEEFYTEVLDQWFKKMRLSKVILLGHSYGGYLSSLYCLKYPKRVKHLVLADPWGFPVRPMQADRRPHQRSKILYGIAKVVAKGNVFTPIRLLGPLGPAVFRKVRGDLGRKYDAYFDDQTLSNYLYACNTYDEPSGETGFRRVSVPIAWAAKPLVERVGAWDPDLDVTFIYGARSWCSSQPGEEIRNQRHGNYVDVQVITGAGHHVYADRPQAFNDMVNKIGQSVDRGAKPNISFRTQQRNQAMTIRRRHSSLSLMSEPELRAQRSLSMTEEQQRVQRSFSMTEEMFEDSRSRTTTSSSNSEADRASGGGGGGRTSISSCEESRSLSESSGQERASPVPVEFSLNNFEAAGSSVDVQQSGESDRVPRRDKMEADKSRQASASTSD